MHNDEEGAAHEEGRLLRNILKTVFLVAVLIGAWFLLDWLINGK